MDLTPTELRLLAILYNQAYKLGGINRKSAAEYMRITQNSLNQYLKNIYFKLNVHDVTSAVIRGKEYLPDKVL